MLCVCAVTVVSSSDDSDDDVIIGSSQSSIHHSNTVSKCGKTLYSCVIQLVGESKHLYSALCHKEMRGT